METYGIVHHRYMYDYDRISVIEEHVSIVKAIRRAVRLQLAVDGQVYHLSHGEHARPTYRVCRLNVTKGV
jgi:hypothetical protein